MAKAKKCRHCGEWLEQPAALAEQPIQHATEDEADTEDGKQFIPPCTSGTTVILLILAVIGEFLSLVHEDWMAIAIEENSVFHSGKWQIIDEIFIAMQQVPEWLHVAITFIAVLGLLVLFLKGMKRMPCPFTSLLGCLIGFYAFMGVLAFIGSISITESLSISEEAAGVLAAFTLLVVFTGAVLQIILGIKLIRFYDGTIWLVGLLFIITGGVGFILLKVLLSSSNPFSLMPIITSSLSTGLDIFLYIQLASLLGISSRIKDVLMYTTGLLVVGVLIYGINV